jgi:rod shape-determining protein MreC
MSPFALMFLAAALMVLDWVGNRAIRDFRKAALEVAAPVLEVASRPALLEQRMRRQFGAYLDAVSEAERLRAENKALKQWQSRATQLEAEVREYRRLMLAVDDSRFSFATARAISDGRGPFVRSVLLNIGRARGVANGFAVVSSDGFLGRIVETGERASRVLLITDLNSRIPVLVGDAGARAIMRGNNDGEPVLEFMPAGRAIADGEAVVTSGQDGLLPRGLSVGHVSSHGGAYTVQPNARTDDIDYVSVLFYAAPALDLANGGTGDGEHLASKAR